ncbi:MAG TPA: hypothetical protein PKD16_18090 [Saprospiraceae bacterium]|jgi:hypothetical protein|nr:hypothetical protein [Saprospiraceae bacterium]HMT72085.1 hypothetical protein [Saprospiraceae bacterium]
MIQIRRLEKPNILERNEAEWFANFIASGKDRPDPKKYAHKDIKDKLMQMSFNKCFYSEYKFSENEGEVDHYIEIKEDKNGAFAWDNLYLSLKQVNNGKTPNSIIPINNTLDPCNDSDEEIEQHVYFKSGEIYSSTPKGSETIKKYRLDHPLLNQLRANKLIEFYETLQILSNNQIKENGRDLTEAEIVILRRFAKPDYPFSLMFRLLLKKLNLL